MGGGREVGGGGVGGGGVGGGGGGGRWEVRVGWLGLDLEALFPIGQPHKLPPEASYL